MARAKEVKMTLANLHAAASRLLADGDVPIIMRPTLYDKALSWLRTAPRTAPQIAELLGIKTTHASVLLSHLRKQGMIEAIGWVEGKRCPMLLCRAVRGDT